MTDTGVIDRFLEVFTRYIDSGFGLLGGEVAFIASSLVVIDITLAALFWAWAPGDDVMARLVKKILFVGFFAFLIGNFSHLANIVFQSFSGLGLKASGSAMSAADFLRPGKLAQAGIDAGRPMLESASQMSGFPGFFENFVQIAVLMVAFVIVVIAFFVLAVQLFVTLIEFKLTTLAGFVLVPFGLFGKTAFLAERVLGNVVASGVKVLVMAVIVGIGSTLFDTFVSDFGGDAPTLEEVLAVMLGTLSLLGLGIFGPGIATGLVSGAPQLGAGAAVGTGVVVGGVAAAAAAGVGLAAGAGAGLAGRAGLGAVATRTGGGGASGASGASAAGGPPKGPAGGGSGSAASGPTSGGSPSGGATPAGGSSASAADPDGRSGPNAAPSTADTSYFTPQGAEPAGAGAADTGFEAPPPSGSESTGPERDATRRSAPQPPPQPAPYPASSERPAWARDMARRQALAHGVQTAIHAVRTGDRPGGGASVSVSEDRS
ncbi:P-type conjugative transfer protein TrbL [Brevundimonas sp. NIBR10]|uniref:P-type conjugative transfer protein TrbL n=1 Tax=Brevundimonas sp. NIBR10 TaxID=3015997 RepID=UPI0022F1872B|nr:P-type conjugative transfer protein TrbL [Brevundimonas sp. NIBR10]